MRLHGTPRSIIVLGVFLIDNTIFYTQQHIHIYIYSLCCSSVYFSFTHLVIHFYNVQYLHANQRSIQGVLQFKSIRSRSCWMSKNMFQKMNPTTSLQQDQAQILWQCTNLLVLQISEFSKVVGIEISPFRRSCGTHNSTNEGILNL